METTRSRGSFLAPIALLFALALPGSLVGQDGDVPPADPVEEGADGKETGTKESDVPPIPDWQPTDPEVREMYEGARRDLDEQRYSEAERTLKKLRSKARGTDGESVVERCLREAEGGELCEKAGKFRTKGQYRKVVALWVKNGEDLAGTFTGKQLEEYHDEAMAMIFHVLDDFEKEVDEEGKEKEESEPEPGSPEELMRRVGAVGYGANTRVISGTPEDGEVRRGKAALRWQLTQELGVVTFDIPDEVSIEDYRYLRISLRNESRGSDPAIVLIFDCEDTPIGGGFGGGGGGRGLGRAVARVMNVVQKRVGFHGELEPTTGWKDLRIDLRRLDPRGEPKWPNVLSLKLIHVSGGEGGLLIDDVILERE